MSEDDREEEFKPIRITLSQEAFERLEKIKNAAKFRSHSATIEECIRIFYDVLQDIHSVIGERGDPFTPFELNRAAEAFKTIAIRMERITGRKYGLKHKNGKNQSHSP